MSIDILVFLEVLLMSLSCLVATVFFSKRRSACSSILMVLTLVGTILTMLLKLVCILQALFMFLFLLCWAPPAFCCRGRAFITSLWRSALSNEGAARQHGSNTLHNSTRRRLHVTHDYIPARRYALSALRIVSSTSSLCRQLLGNLERERPLI